MSVSFKFDFGPGEVEPGYVQVQHTTAYSIQLGYGFTDISKISARDRGMPDALRGDFCIPLESTFKVDVPNGNYTVTAIMGDSITATLTTVKAGAGRLMLNQVQTAAGQFIRQSFTVHVENEQLSLHFSGIAPRINALEIVKATQATTIFMAGDSTVTDQSADGYPYAGWGQMFPACCKADLAIANHAVSGRSTKSFVDEGRLDAILELIQANDYLFIQFGHNDEKPDPERATDPYTTYQKYLRMYIEGARKRGAYPILITPMHRRFFDDKGSVIDSHGDYIDAMKQLAAEENVPVIDLAEKSKQLYEMLGPERSKTLFMWAFPGEFPNFPGGVEDNTHFQEIGAIQIAKLVVEGIKEQFIHPLYLYLK